MLYELINGFIGAATIFDYYVYIYVPRRSIVLINGKHVLNYKATFLAN